MNAHVRRNADRLREIIVDEERKRAARRLLEAAIGVAVEPAQQRRHIIGTLARQRDGELGAFRIEAVEERRRQCERSTGRELRDLLGRHRTLAGAHLDRPRTGERDARPVELEADRSDAGLAARQGNEHHALRALAQIEAEMRRVGGDGAVRRDRDIVVAGGTLDIVDEERRRCLVVRREEARQAEVRNDRVAHRQRHRGFAELIVIVGDRHQPQLADIVGNVELDRAVAVAVELHDAGEQRDRARRHDG